MDKDQSCIIILSRTDYWLINIYANYKSDWSEADLML